MAFVDLSISLFAAFLVYVGSLFAAFLVYVALLGIAFSAAEFVSLRRQRRRARLRLPRAVLFRRRRHAPDQ